MTDGESPALAGNGSRPPADGGREGREAMLLDAAAGLLAEGHPLTTLSVSRITRQAGLGRSTFYQHFPDKDDLIVRLATRAAARLAATLQPLLGGREGATDEDLLRLVRELVSWYREHGLVAAAYVEAAARARPDRQQVPALADGIVGAVTTAIEAERRVGRAHAGIDAAATAWVLTTFSHDVLLAHVRTRGPAEDERVARAMARILWLAVYGGSDSPPARGDAWHAERDDAPASEAGEGAR